MGMADVRAHRQRRFRRGGARGLQGFSLVEVLIASAILLIIALGILPLFTQAIVNNRAGADYTTATNAAKSELERLFALPMSSPDLAVTAGTQTQRSQYFSSNEQRWKDAIDSSDKALWTRTITIENYLLKSDGTLLGPRPAGEDVHVKEIEVQVERGASGGPLGLGKRIRLRVYKAF
jgi:prepilin-type N-terminal cleavage/methylation domain-containing protein